MNPLLLLVLLMYQRENRKSNNFCSTKEDSICEPFPDGYDDMDIGRLCSDRGGGTKPSPIPQPVPQHYIYVFEKEDPNIPVKRGVLRILNVPET